MLNKVTKKDILIFSGLFLLAFAVVFISCLNPFTSKELDTDTSLYLTIAQGITRGQVPFRDFVDNKGPLVYLISTPGMFLGGFLGVWLTELIFMFISVLFAYKTALFFGEKKYAFWAVIFSFIVFQSFFYEAAGTEEYALPFIMISLYIFVKYFFTQKEPPFYELLILGICCAVSFFIRINMFPLWLGFCIAIVIESLFKRKFLPLLRYILFFSAGLLIAAIPVFLYLYLNNAFFDYIHQNFIVGGSRGFSGFSIKGFTKSFFMVLEKNYCYLPLPFYFAWIVKKYKNVSVFLYIGLLLSYILTAVFLAVIQVDIDHYNMVLVPFLIPVFTVCTKFIFEYFSTVKYKKIVLSLFISILFAKMLLAYFFGDFGVYAIIKDTSRREAISVGKIIDQNTNKDDTIIFMGKPYYIYLFTERKAASRYIYQGSGINYDPNARKEFLEDMQNNKPAIIGIRNIEGNYDHLPDWYLPVYDMIENEYHILYDSDRYFLFKRGL